MTSSKLFGAALALIMSVLLTIDAFACRCRTDKPTDLDLQAEICRSSSIFIASALTTRTHPDYKVEHVLKVERVLKGDVSGLVQSVPGQGAMCHKQFSKSETYIVFATHPGGDERFVSNKCGHTRSKPTAEFLARVEAHVANSEKVCSQDFSKLQRDHKDSEYERLIEETNRILSSEEDDT